VAAIDLLDVSLDYPIYDAGSRSLKNAMLRGIGGRIAADQGRVAIQALRGVSLQLRDGDRLALIGHNGAGKSTLLKVLAGIYEPPEGRVRIEGRVSSLTDLTMGMDMEATGYENIVMRGVFLGLSRAEARARLPEIETFTELGEFLRLPVRSYSAGMLVRLAFAVSTASRPEILIMDEMIGAGDAAFAEKARARVTDYIARSSILVLASHDGAVLRQFCNKGALLQKGRLERFGPIEDVLGAYERRPAAP
jgi:ABC-2 type transport system ATP-binding protein/lipopolysaccharide transport system ATP-binding protein